VDAQKARAAQQVVRFTVESPARITTVLLVLCALAEVTLLFLIATHPAGGWEANPKNVFAGLMVLAALPLVVGFQLVARGQAKRCLRFHPFARILPAFVVGPLPFLVGAFAIWPWNADLSICRLVAAVDSVGDGAGVRRRAETHLRRYGRWQRVWS